VTEIGQGERTFHVFYQYVAALQSSAKDGYRYKYAGGGATNSCSYKFVPFEGAKRGVLPQMMSGGGVVRLEDQTANDELEEFDQTLHAMHVLGIPVADQESLFSMLTAILLLSCVASDAPGVPGAAKQVDERAMEMRLGVLSRILGIRNVSKLAHVCNNSGAIHSLGRLLYVQLWHWLLSAANAMLAVVPGSSTPAGEVEQSGNYATVSILDMFGFENFKKNGFEQLCTNFTHEVLTKYIFQDVHAQERVLYQNEGIRYEGVVADRTHDRYTNYAETTSEVVNFLRSGIFPVLEGLAEVDTSTSNGKAYAELSEVERKQKLDKLFCSRLRSQFGAGKNPRFVEKRTMSDTFAVKHFGGTEVTYSAQGFSWKNQDPYSVELYAFLKAESESAFLKKILGAGNNGETVLSPATKVLRSQLDRVMELVEGSERHFCICLNPNTRSVGGLFARNYVAEQLKAQGLLELVHAKRGGYPVRYTRAAFWAEFRALYPPGGAGGRGATKSAAPTTSALLSTSQVGQKKSLTDRRPAAEASSPKDKATGASNLLNKGTTDDNLLQSDFFARVAEKYESVKTAIDLGGECAVGTTTVFLTDVMLRALKGAMAEKNAYYATKVTATWRAGKTRTRFLYIMKGVRKIQRFVKGYQSLKTKRKFQHLIWLLHEKGAKPKAGINAGAQGKTSVLSAATTAEASAEETALEAEAREVSEERARLQQQKIDLMHAHEKEKAKMVLAEAEGEAAPFAFYIEGDDIVDGVGGGGGSGGSGRGGKNPGGARDVLTTLMQLLGDAVASSSDSKVKAAWDKLQGSLKQVLDEVEDAPKRTQYLLERQERELRKQAEQEKEHLMEVVKHKFGAMVDLTPEQAARRARQAISNIDLEFQCSKLKKDLAEITGGVDPDELFTLSNTEEMFENFDFDRISPVWTERLVRNLRRTKKPLDVLILGPKNVGKTELIRRMYKTGGFDMPAAFINPKTGEEYSFATLGGRAQNAIREDPEHFLPDIVRHDFDYGGGFNLRILDCHARLSESSLYRRSLYSQAHWVFVVYTVTRQESVQSALALLQEAKKFNNNVLLLGNLIFESETVKATSRSMQRRVAAEAREVNLNYVKARADKHQGIVMETNELLTATKLAVESMMAPSEVVHYVPSLRTALEHSTQQPPEARRAEMRDAENELKEDVRKRIAGVADTDKPTVAEHEAENSYIRYPIAEAFDYNFMTLIPPAEDKGHQKLLRKAADPKRTGSPDGRLNYNDDAEGMQKLQQQAEEEDYDAGLDRDLILVEKRKPKAPAAVTCLAWGLEQRVKTFSFLVVGYKDGHIALYRMNHTKTDFELIHMESEQETGVLEESTDYMRLVKAVGGQLKDEGAFSHVATWKGHKSAVTSVQFTSTEQRLITTSTDRTMRMWNLEQQHDHFVQHGHPHLQFVLEDAYAISCCCTVPAFPQLFVLANSCGNLRVGDYLTGGIVQKFSHMEEVRCLAIDKRQGNYLFGGTKFGELFVVDCERPGDFKFLPGLGLKLNQEWQGCTDMKFGSLPVVGSQPGYSRENEWGWQDLLVVNCADNSVVTAQVTYQRESNLILTMTVLHRYPNLQTVLPLRSCFSNHGFILTAGEDRHVHVHTIHNPQHVCSLLHDEPTVCVDLNRSHTMLATGDVMGNLYIWRVYEKQDPNAEGGEPGSRGEEPGSAANKGPASRGSEPRSSTGADGDGKKADQAGPKSGGPPSSSDGRGSKKAGSGSGSDSSKSSGKGKNNEPGTVAPGFGGGNSGSDSEMPANYRATTNEPGTMAAAFGGRASS